MTWDEATLAATKRLTDKGLDWNAVSENDRHLAALFKVEADMHNGGFVQFFCNWGPAGLTHARAALLRIGAVERETLLARAYAVIAHHEDDPRLATLWDLPKVLTDAEATELQALDERYWHSTEDVALLGATALSTPA